MEIEAIVQELNRRLAAPLPEFHKRHVIFWRDEDQEFLDQLFELQLILPAKFVQLKGNNNFKVKKLLEHGHGQRFAESAGTGDEGDFWGCRHNHFLQKRSLIDSNSVHGFP